MVTAAAGFGVVCTEGHGPAGCLLLDPQRKVRGGSAHSTAHPDFEVNSQMPGFAFPEGHVAEHWASLSPEECLRALGSGPSGLTPAEARGRLERFGPNEPPRLPPPRWYRELARAFVHLFAVLLWIAALLAWVAGTPPLAVAIVLVIVVNGVFSFWQEYRAERAAEALEALLPRRVLVRRSGQEEAIAATEVVPGDILVLRSGEAIPADARLIRAEGLRIDVSTLTGESRPVPRVSDPVEANRQPLFALPNLVFAGTFVVAGAGEAVVFATGMATEFGRLAALTQRQREQPSPLQRELGRVTRVVTVVALSLGIGSFALAELLGKLSPADAFLFALGIIVANVPEGLLPTLTLALAAGVRSMAQRNALVKRLSTVEAVGATTVILTDKTGTLTANQMTVRQCWTAAGEATVTGTGYAPEGEIVWAQPVAPEATNSVRRLLRAAALCSNAHVERDRASGRWRTSGDPTEVALVVAAAKAGIPRDQLECWPRLAELPFDSVRKRMTTIQRDGDRALACTKGALSEVLPRCTQIATGSGNEPLVAEWREALRQAHTRLARLGLRVLAVAERDLGPIRSEAWHRSEVERDLTFLGLVAMEDPPRPEAPEAIRACRRAGIRVCMVTGDDPQTALAIGREIGLYGETVRIVTGPELDRLHAAALDQLVRSGEVLFARVNPEHKLRLVETFQQQGEVVAVTGDGVNDAPALRRAEIGVAMGISGTDVAREAADMILLDDNFATIVAAIREGRSVYDNVRKFVTYIFASNVPEIVPFVVFALFAVPLPLTVLQILAVDLGTDLLPALALGREPPEPDVMDRPPRSRRQRLLDLRVLARAYGWLGPIEAALSLGAFFWVYWQAGWRPGHELAASGPLYAQATTATFAAIVACQVGNAWACRSERASVWSLGFFTNPLLGFAVVAEVALLLAFLHWPPLAWVFGFAPLHRDHWAPILCFPLLFLAAEEARKRLWQQR